MQKRSQSTLEPRKSPVQARSAASVEAVLKATIQVLLKAGRERLTTTRVAARAGVSVGTLYQYFPNKSALLRAALQRHMDEIVSAMETVCREQAGSSLETMATALVTGFLEAKMRDPKTSVALYAVSSDVDGARISREMGMKANRAIVAMLATAKDELTSEPQMVAAMLQATMAGVSRRLLESASPEEDYEKLRDELVFLARAYLRACTKDRARYTQPSPHVSASGAAAS
ncbi:TetR/AcrR family transcriptional regulator [Paracidobacterium acidisoli]|uniref:TetR/AcrR family transcriptional regulator n=1 Tax=Paracidobacterium acidisoli TaxID=2303751 RepID=A0A372IQ15_9BACT|nr:TetR/AcrR family transcriptional regulator [Paracidobacterium acidisoli]MBT9331381.1 TetR/AcrR family transcriptional regulator [Paracidobacterium acidisoli]